MKIREWLRLWLSKRAYRKWEKSLRIGDAKVKERDWDWLTSQKRKRGNP